MKTKYFNTRFCIFNDIKYKAILSKKGINQKVGKSQILKIYFFLLFFFEMGRIGPIAWVGLNQAQDPWAGLDGWLLCMSTVTSFTSLAEMCTVHVLHGEGKNESKRKGGKVFTWRGGDASDC